MGGLSLWLVPLQTSPFTKIAQELITDTIPPNFAHTVKKHNFAPHVTVTSDIDAETAYKGNDDTHAQTWLDGLDLPGFVRGKDECVVELDHLEVGDPVFRKLVVEVSREPNLLKLAEACRRQAVPGDSAEAWTRDHYAPHMSLLYADLTPQEVKQKVGLVELQIGWALGSLFDCCGGTLCMGGEIVLVDTRGEVEDWMVVARRDMPAVMWKMSRNLI